MMNEIIDVAEGYGKRRDDMTFVHFTRILTGPHMNEVLKSVSKDQVSRIRERYVVGSPENCVEKLQEYVDIGVDLILLRLHHLAQTSFAKEKEHHQQIMFINNEIISQLR